MNKTLRLSLTLVWVSAGLFTNPVYSDETRFGRVPGTAVMSGSVSGPQKFTAAKVYAKNLDKNMLYMVYTKDRKSTRLNSSHALISYAVFCLKKKK